MENAMNGPTPALNGALLQAKAAKPWYRHPWPWLLMLGPAAVVAAGAHTTWIAFTQQDALVVDDYYKQGKAINQDLRRDRAALRLGITSVLRYEPASGSLTGTVASRAGAQTEALVIQLVHSTQPEKDIKLLVRPDAAGNFSVRLPMLEKALWQVQVENVTRDWRLHAAWGWPQERSVTLTAG
jgi:hypothetical protein